MSNNKSADTYSVGQTLYWESSTSRGNGDVTITKVGRIWLELNNGYRVDKLTLRSDPGKYNPPGQCYISKEVRLAELDKQDAWSDLHKRVMAFSGVAPKKISLENIRKVLSLLTQ